MDRNNTQGSKDAEAGLTGGGVAGDNRMCTFPDGSSYPVVTCEDGGAEHFLVKYLHDGTPQILWVPRGFVED